jgi:hypothetical protein
MKLSRTLVSRAASGEVPIHPDFVLEKIGPAHIDYFQVQLPRIFVIAPDWQSSSHQMRKPQRGEEIP